MRHDEYHRLHKACLAMAKQSPTPDAQARWQAMAGCGSSVRLNGVPRRGDALATQAPLPNTSTSTSPQRC
jgi:hypothetical protein